MKPADPRKGPSTDIFDQAFARRFLSEMADKYENEIAEFKNRRQMSGNSCMIYDINLAVRPCAAPEDETDAKKE